MRFDVLRDAGTRCCAGTRRAWWLLLPLRKMIYITLMTHIRHSPALRWRRHALLCGHAEGGLGLVAPVPDPAAASRLQALQSHLSRALPHVGGLNPRAFRWAGYWRAWHRNREARGGGKEEGRWAHGARPYACGAV